MGANFESVYVKGEASQAELHRFFKLEQAQCAWESGHEYSGRLNMCQGLSIVTKVSFETIKLAEDWISEHAEKWEEALAVKAKHKNGEPVWVIGGWCAS